MARKDRLAAPRIDALRLADLADSDARDLDRGMSVEGLRYSRVDLTDRDLSGTSFSECEFLDVVAHSTQFRGATFAESVFERLDAPVLRAARSTLRDVRLTGSRVGSGELFDSTWASVEITDCKLGYLNLRGARLRDVRFANCTIDELDVGGAELTRVSFHETRVGVLDVTRARAKDTDVRSLDIASLTGIDGLRGMTMSSDQITALAPLFAAMHGILQEDAR